MGATRYSGVIQSGIPAAGTVGPLLTAQRATFSFIDTGSFTVPIIIPARSQILFIQVIGITAWNSVTTDALEVGAIGQTSNFFADAYDLQDTGILEPSLVFVQNWDDTGTSDLQIQLTINSVGGSLTQGSAFIQMAYLQEFNA